MPRNCPPEFWRNAALPSFEGRRAFDSSACYLPHTHPALSIGIIDSGEATFTVGEHTHPLRAGDVVFVDERQVHACNPLPGARWSYRMFYIDRPWALRAAGASWSACEGTTLRGRLAEEAVEQLTGALSCRDPKKARAIAESATATLLHRLPPATSAAPAQRRALELAGAELESHRGRGPRSSRTAPTEAGTLERARLELEARCEEAVPVSALARACGLSDTQLIRGFRQRYGLPPHAYQLDVRITRAKAMLRNGHGIADVAHALGFADQSHFHRVFSHRVAATPAQYRLD
jgi:AraC-like DNA-binding protein